MIGALANRRLGCEPLVLSSPETGTHKETKMKVLIAAMFATSFLFLSGCNTMEGAGKDVEAGGKKVEKEAIEHKKY